jgi:hypothetical protein
MADVLLNYFRKVNQYDGISIVHQNATVQIIIICSHVVQQQQHTSIRSILRRASLLFESSKVFGTLPSIIIPMYKYLCLVGRLDISIWSGDTAKSYLGSSDRCPNEGLTECRNETHTHETAAAGFKY